MCTVDKSENSGRPLLNWKTASLAKVQLCEFKSQTLEAFVVASHLYAKFGCPVAHPIFATCEKGCY